MDWLFNFLRVHLTSLLDEENAKGSMSKGEKLSLLDEKLLTFPIFQESKIHTVYGNETHSEIHT